MGFFGRRTYLPLIICLVVSIAILTAHFRGGDRGVVRIAQRAVLSVAAPVQKSVTSIIGSLQEEIRFVSNIGSLRKENERLRGEMLELAELLEELDDTRTENERLRGLVGFQDRTAFTTQPARVIGRPASNWQSTVVIDKGRRDGIERNMAVVAAEGLVGQIIETSENASLVLLITDSQSGVSVQVERTGEFAVVQGQVDGSLILNYVPKDSMVEVGDKVHTSGLGGVFPLGIFVGTVAEVQEAGFTLHKNVTLSSPVDFAGIREVLVVSEPVLEGRFFEED